jgi:hypothetical protein
MTNLPERRFAPRYELLAQANVASGEEAYLLSVRNISMTGAFLEGSPSDYPDLKLGAETELTLSASDPSMGDDEVVNVRCRGRVARVEAARPPHVGGFGITLEPMSTEDEARLRALVGRLALPPPRPASLRP